MLVVVKYHNRRMLLTLDLNALVEVIMATYGDGTSIEFMPMTDDERDETLESPNLVNAVRERFWILEVNSDLTTKRRMELEVAAVESGVK